MVGFAGCIGSSNATHVGLLKCYYKQAQYHNSPKLGIPSRIYYIFVNHQTRILSTTSGNPGQWNNKSIINYDDFAVEMKNGYRCSNMHFNLLERRHNA